MLIIERIIIPKQTTIQVFTSTRGALPNWGARWQLQKPRGHTNVAALFNG
jgi:hypothetical protein